MSMNVDSDCTEQLQTLLRVVLFVWVCDVHRGAVFYFDFWNAAWFVSVLRRVSFQVARCRRASLQTDSRQLSQLIPEFLFSKFLLKNLAQFWFLCALSLMVLCMCAATARQSHVLGLFGTGWAEPVRAGQAWIPRTDFRVPWRTVHFPLSPLIMG